jgi:rod shape-determining protein MreB
MLCSEPFSVAYGLDMLEDVLVIDIGAGTTDLCRMHGTMPEEADQIISTRRRHVDDELEGADRRAFPEGAQFTIADGQGDQGALLARRRRSRARDRHPAGRRQAHASSTSPTRSSARARSWSSRSSTGMRQAHRDVRPRVPDKLKNRVLLAGGGSMIKGLDTAIEGDEAASSAAAR